MLFTLLKQEKLINIVNKTSSNVVCTENYSIFLCYKLFYLKLYFMVKVLINYIAIFRLEIKKKFKLVIFSLGYSKNPSHQYGFLFFIEWQLLKLLNIKQSVIFVNSILLLDSGTKFILNHVELIADSVKLNIIIK